MEIENNSTVSTATTAEGAKGQEFTDPAETEGAKGQEFTDPAGAEGTEVMSAEERHAQAEKRRNAERETEREKIRQELREETRRESQQQFDTFIRSLNKVNPYTNKPITTMQEMEEYNEESRRRKMEQDFKKAGLNPEMINELISSHPDIRAAKEAKAQYEAANQKLKTQTQESGIQRELEAIGKIDPTIKTASDLLSHPKYGEIKKLVAENNHSLRDAFEIATAEDRAAEAQQRVRNSSFTAAAGKSHMRSATSSGGKVDNTAIPANVLANYRAMNPKITLEQAREKWERYQNLKRN